MEGCIYHCGPIALSDGLRPLLISILVKTALEYDFNSCVMDGPTDGWMGNCLSPQMSKPTPRKKNFISDIKNS